MQWMPDGKQIVFSGNEAGHPARCYIQNIDGGNPRPVTPEGVNGCMVSPDGQWIAAGTHSDGGPKLYPLDGSAPHAMVGLLPGEGFTWSTDPHVVYAYLEKMAPVKIYRLNILTGKREMFKEINPSDETGLCDMTHVMFSPNGQSYVFGYTRLLSELYLVSGMK
jgi:WD40 repeat protein